ncbi:MAG: hypothetical protein UY96_C0010G0003 [Parcubacteria group bacterium GW2011_GWB1_56_8]|nr:MAG: hypothetical protein UY96_C0010G0003 [Parcubacteria group bacterium GW2011_GWB1_56_8]
MRNAQYIEIGYTGFGATPWQEALGPVVPSAKGFTLSQIGLAISKFLKGNWSGAHKHMVAAYQALNQAGAPSSVMHSVYVGVVSTEIKHPKTQIRLHTAYKMVQSWEPGLQGLGAFVTGSGQERVGNDRVGYGLGGWKSSIGQGKSWIFEDVPQPILDEVPVVPPPSKVSNFGPAMPYGMCSSAAEWGWYDQAQITKIKMLAKEVRDLLSKGSESMLGLLQANKFAAAQQKLDLAKIKAKQAYAIAKDRFYTFVKDAKGGMAPGCGGQPAEERKQAVVQMLDAGNSAVDHVNFYGHVYQDAIKFQQKEAAKIQAEKEAVIKQQEEVITQKQQEVVTQTAEKEAAKKSALEAGTYAMSFAECMKAGKPFTECEGFAKLAAASGQVVTQTPKWVYWTGGGALALGAVLFLVGRRKA